jgi:hypothetical protein
MSTAPSWAYRPEFTCNDAGEIVRGDPPALVHSSGSCIDLATSPCVSADMLDAEGKHVEAQDVRSMASGDLDAFCRVFNMARPATCSCGSGFYPWWQTLSNGSRAKLCDRCMPKLVLR